MNKPNCSTCIHLKKERTYASDLYDSYKFICNELGETFGVFSASVYELSDLEYNKPLFGCPFENN